MIVGNSTADVGVTTPVGIFPHSAAVCGAHDLAGNVWEWCIDALEPTKVDDPNAGRVLRGGSFAYSAQYVRSAFRFCNFPVNRNDFIGFRVARTYN